MPAWLKSKKDDIVTFVIVVVLFVLFVLVAPYCC